MRLTHCFKITFRDGAMLGMYGDQISGWYHPHSQVKLWIARYMQLESITIVHWSYILRE